MARNIVPRSDKDADLGTSLKNWNNIYTDKLTLRGSDLQALLDEQTDAGYFVEDQIVDGVTDKSASQNAVYDALAGKSDTSHTHSQYVSTSDYDNADVLAKVKAVDGSGSGLDADTLDGLHASEIGGGLYSAPPALSWSGNGSNGSFTTSGNVTLDGIRQYTNFNVQSGHTVTVGSKGYLFILCQGQCTISGTITSVGKGAAGGASSGTERGATGELGGAGGGGGEYVDETGGGSFYTFLHSVPGGSGGDGANKSGSPGSPSPLSPFQAASAIMTIYRGCGGGGGGARTVGGSGGGTIVIIAESISFTGTVSSNGANGSVSSYIGSGGGGGGIAIMAAREWQSNTGTLTAAGGIGGYGLDVSGGNGGNGVTGTFLIE